MDKPILLLITYRPRGIDITNWLESFALIMNKISHEHGECIILSDFNVDI